LVESGKGYSRKKGTRKIGVEKKPAEGRRPEVAEGQSLAPKGLNTVPIEWQTQSSRIVSPGGTGTARLGKIRSIDRQCKNLSGKERRTTRDVVK